MASAGSLSGRKFLETSDVMYNNRVLNMVFDIILSDVQESFNRFILETLSCGTKFHASGSRLYHWTTEMLTENVMLD